MLADELTDGRHKASFANIFKTNRKMPAELVTAEFNSST
jgi:hypothetical protein